MTFEQLLVLIPSHGLEDLPTELAEKPAASLLNGFACLWHPSLIAATGQLPRWQRADAPETQFTKKLVLVPLSCMDLLPAGWIEQSREEGSVVITGEHEREKMLARALEPLGEIPALDPELVADFLAFGTCYLLLELLTRRMRSYGNIDEVTLEREIVAAAAAAIQQDGDAARKHLSLCFEKLLESRERFYPVECFLLDLCLVAPNTGNDRLQQLLLSSTPVNLQAPAKDWEKLLEKEPVLKEEIRSALNRKTTELIGGDDVELPSTLMSLDATVWHLQQGGHIFANLFGVRPRVWSRKRYGLGPHLPQLLDRLGYQGALHLALDDGIYPDQEQSQVRWEGSSGICLNSISRIPLAADGASGMLRFPERMSESMDMDHVAAVIFARWPDLRTPFLEDLRRGHTYAPVLGKFVCFEEFFAHADGPGRQSSPRGGEYLSPILIQDVAAHDADPIGRHVRYWERERAFLRVDWTRQLGRLLKNESGVDPVAAELERTVQSAHPESTSEVQAIADAAIRDADQSALKDLLPLLTAGGVPGPGVLVVNSLSFPRKTLIDWPSGSYPQRDANILATQIENDQVRVLVNLPPCGFVWLRASPTGVNTAPGKNPMAEELLLRNDNFEVRFSNVTGGIAGIQTYHRSPNRISQQVALRFPHEKLVTTDDGEERQSIKTFYTSMRLRESRVLSEGPLVGELETQGDLFDDHAGEVVGTYLQRTRVVRGRPVVEVDLEISSGKEIEGNPWTNYIGCRFAWKHIEVALTGSMQQGAQAVTGQRIEAPHYLEIADDDFRTTLLMPGMPFHRKTGERMLDMLLLTEGETTRKFQFAIAIDAKYPMQACLDEYSPPAVIATSTQPPEESRTGWFFGLSAANVQLTRIFPSPNPDSVIVRLLETEGRGRVLGLQCFRTPRSARQVNFQGETITELRIDDAVNVEISPYELCDVELTF